MTSLAALAHTAAAPAFNGLFYATAATVIPVLFLAIAVQGNAYETLLRAWQITFRLVLGAAFRGISLGFFVSALAFYGLLILLGFAIVATGGYGELFAVYALYQRHDQASTRQTVLLATMFLIILVVAGPLLRYLWELLAPQNLVRAVKATSEPGGSDSRPDPGKTDLA